MESLALRRAAQGRRPVMNALYIILIFIAVIGMLNLVEFGRLD
jgi:hypothetical protein